MKTSKTYRSVTGQHCENSSIKMTVININVILKWVQNDTRENKWKIISPLNNCLIEEVLVPS